MEIEFYFNPSESRERFLAQSGLVLLLALGLILWGHWIVFADPSLNVPVQEDSRVPLSKRVFDSAGEWRATEEESERKWRESEEERLTLQKSRIKKKSSSLYNPSVSQDDWDPFSPMGHPDTLTRPAKVFEFKF